MRNPFKNLFRYVDLYNILGVCEYASDSEITKAYRVLVRKFHPNVNKGSDAEEKFKEVQKAYEVLGNQQKRAQYDKFRDLGGDDGFNYEKEKPNFDLDYITTEYLNKIWPKSDCKYTGGSHIDVANLLRRCVFLNFCPIVRNLKPKDIVYLKVPIFGSHFKYRSIVPKDEFVRVCFKRAKKLIDGNPHSHLNDFDVSKFGELNVENMHIRSSYKVDGFVRYQYRISNQISCHFAIPRKTSLSKSRKEEQKQINL